MATKKKNTISYSRRTGIAAASLDQGFGECKRYFHVEVEKKELADLMKAYVRKKFSKKDASAILANPEYNFSLYSHFNAGIHWINNGLEFEEKYSHMPEALNTFFSNLIITGEKILKKELDVQESDKEPTVVISPQQRLLQKIQATVMVDIDELEDQWIDGEKNELDIYTKFKLHGLTGQSVEPVRKRFERWLSEYSDAYNKKCQQAVEAYSHINKSELKRRINAINKMLEDLNKVKAAAKATRKVRTPKPKAADKQISKLQYKKEDGDFKLVSINPISIIGAMKLYTFNVKSKKITEFVCSSTSGFEISGTSLKNVDLEQSRTATLRKPQDFIPIVQSKSARQIDNAFKALTTKVSEPNARINADTILIRVL